MPRITVTVDYDVGDAPPPAGGGGRFSGLPFPSLLFQDNGDLDTAAAFSDQRGRPMDGVLFFNSRGSWGDMLWIRDFSDYLNSGGMVVTSLPHAPESEGGQMNSRGASNAYRSQQRNLAAQWAGQGLNSPNHVLRLDWESNGDWYPWSANRGGGEALKQSLINCITNLRDGGLDQVKFDLCYNKGPSQSGADFDYFPGPEYVDIVGVDHYDMWPPAPDADGWEAQQSQSPSLRAVAEFAASHGILWALDEGGNTHGDQNQGGDNRYYWERVWEFLVANAGNCHHHVTYNDTGAPESLQHDFDHNPDSWNYYRRPDRWGG